MKTVGELREALIGLEDNMEVILRVTTDGGDTLHMMNIKHCSIEAWCTDTDALVIDGYAEERLPVRLPMPMPRTAPRRQS